ncbi:MAG: hypothetical protein QM621_00275 [Aeromicrobium sp.]|uniref:hypothetical protein n=1 Tax=Aeromicrobium sp. TaxID=1871063 RepID=UPI0039E46EE8
MNERQVRFADSAWSEIEALPQPWRGVVQRTIFSLLHDPTPALANLFLSTTHCLENMKSISRLTM